MKTKRQSNSGLTVVEALIVVAVLAVLVAMLLPALSTRCNRNPRIGCVNNLKQIGLSFQQWSLDYGDKLPTQVPISNEGARESAESGNVWLVFQVMSNELNTPKILICPADAKRTNDLSFSGNLKNWEVSYFVGLDAVTNAPTALLAGDSDLEANGALLPSGLAELSTNRIVQWSNKRHKKQGNVAFADGSVQSYANKQLPGVFQATGLATNRLAIP